MKTPLLTTAIPLLFAGCLGLAFVGPRQVSAEDGSTQGSEPAEGISDSADSGDANTDVDAEGADDTVHAEDAETDSADDGADVEADTDTQGASDSAGASGSDDELFDELYAEGEVVFHGVCEACHGPEGGGGIGVPLRENTQYTKYVIRAIFNGSGNMPPVASEFSDREIAAVVTFVSNSWGNDYGIVTEEDVVDSLDR